ncbi:MAG: hypothetical protein ABSC49_04050 [Candidatus Microgenomates bacterium]|jgi:hypothetical protein
MESKERPPFGKPIVTTNRKGEILIYSQGGNLPDARFRNPVKDTLVPAEILDDLVSVVTRAFPDEFEGTEGQAKEIELLKDVRSRYPSEQPSEVADRLMPALMAQGVSADKIANDLLSRNAAVKKALNLASSSKAEIEKKNKDLRDAILYHWPSPEHK